MRIRPKKYRLFDLTSRSSLTGASRYHGAESSIKIVLLFIQ
jgi:hypothetical protein